MSPGSAAESVGGDLWNQVLFFLEKYVTLYGRLNWARLGFIKRCGLDNRSVAGQTGKKISWRKASVFINKLRKPFFKRSKVSPSFAPDGPNFFVWWKTKRVSTEYGKLQRKENPKSVVKRFTVAGFILQSSRNKSACCTQWTKGGTSLAAAKRS